MIDFVCGRKTNSRLKHQCPLFLIHAVARLGIAFIWIWQGLVPKLLFRDIDERYMLAQAGLSQAILPWIGAGEVLIGVLILWAWRMRAVLLANASVMVGVTAIVVARSPTYVVAAFNPVTLNFGVFALAITGWIASRTIPSARKCLRTSPNDAA